MIVAGPGRRLGGAAGSIGASSDRRMNSLPVFDGTLGTCQSTLMRLFKHEIGFRSHVSDDALPSVYNVASHPSMYVIDLMHVAAM
jgi:hypothetical protein